MDGKKTSDALQNVHAYQGHFDLFRKFCDLLRRGLAANNAFAIEIGQLSENELAIKVLHYPCKVRFGVYKSPNALHGMLTVERLMPRDERRRLLAVYFTSEGNATETPTDAGSWHYSIGIPDNALAWFPVRVIDELFKDIAASEDKKATMQRVPLSGF